MALVRVYTTPYCPYCVGAKRLLSQKGVVFEEIDVSKDDELREQMIRESGRRTVPQIFIDGRSLGGFEELRAMDQEGALDAVLGVA